MRRLLLLLLLWGFPGTPAIKSIPEKTTHDAITAKDIVAGSFLDSQRRALLWPPEPEINLKANSGGLGNIISGSSTTNGLNNTAFGDAALGMAITKDFRIENNGMDTLHLTGLPLVVIGGSNPLDFVVSGLPLEAIEVGEYTTFAITFTPQSMGYRSAIVTIANNDSNEHPYTFKIDGHGNCQPASIAITPTSGPVGTQITITAITNNLTAATVSLNGQLMSVTQSGATQLKAIIPPMAASGTIATTNGQGCSATAYFTIIGSIIGSCEGSSGIPRPELFISEITDHGTGSHTFVEIFNATGATVNLLGYSVRIHNNGSATATSTIALPAYILPDNSAYVVAFGGTDATSNPGGTVPNQVSFVSGINGNDNIRLYNESGSWIDVWGNVTGAVFTIAPKDYVYRRKNSGISAPAILWNTSDWIFFGPVNYSDVGVYDFSTGNAPLVVSPAPLGASCGAISIGITAAEGNSGGNTLEYKWFIAHENMPLWEPLEDSLIYNGTATPTLYINDFDGIVGANLYCRILENDAGCYTASNAFTIHAATAVVWNDGVWDPVSGPSSSTFVTIQDTYDTSISGSFEACGLEIANGSAVRIGNGGYISVKNHLAIAAGCVLEVVDDGSLIIESDLGSLINNGTMTVSRTTTPFAKYDYTYWSSPMSNAAIGTTFFDWTIDQAYQWETINYADITGPGGSGPPDGNDDNADVWMAAAAFMVPGVGYAIMGPTEGSTYPMTSTVTFTGTANNGKILVPLELSADETEAGDDFNLIGNPYPSAISADEFIYANPSISGTLLFWTHSTPTPAGDSYTASDYARYNLSGGTAASPNGGAIPTGMIASGQGFFVEASTVGNAVFNNNMRSKAYPNNNFYRTAQTDIEEKDRIWLNISNESGSFSQQLIAYLPAATIANDWGFDAEIDKVGNNLGFYSIIGDKGFRIQGRGPFEIADVVPIGYSTISEGMHEISIDHTEGVLSDTALQVVLEDKFLQVFHDLKQEGYGFIAETGNFEERFELHYVLTSDLSMAELVPKDCLQLVASEGKIEVGLTVGKIVGITLFDTMGRQLYRGGYDHVQKASIDGLVKANQLLLVKVELESGRTMVKKLLW